MLEQHLGPKGSWDMGQLKLSVLKGNISHANAGSTGQQGLAGWPEDPKREWKFSVKLSTETPALPSSYKVWTHVSRKAWKIIMKSRVAFWGLQNLTQRFKAYLHLHYAVTSSFYRNFTQLNRRRNEAHLFKPTKNPQSSKQANKTSFKLNQLQKKKYT